MKAGRWRRPIRRGLPGLALSKVTDSSLWPRSLCNAHAPRPMIGAASEAKNHAFRRCCVSPLQHALEREHIWIFRARAASRCGKSTSIADVVNAALNIALEARRSACLYHVMNTTLIEVRRAKPSDAPAIAATHDEAWRGAYQGIIPGPELDKLINRRGPAWWDCAVRKGSRNQCYIAGVFQKRI